MMTGQYATAVGPDPDRLDRLRDRHPDIAEQVEPGWKSALDALVAVGWRGRSMLRFDHVGVVVDDLAAAAEFFLGLGSKRAGAWQVKRPDGGQDQRLDGVQAEVMMVQTPDGSGKLELVKYHAPAGTERPHPLPANRLGFRHICIEVNNLNAIMNGLRNSGFGTVGEVCDYETSIGSATSAARKD